MPFSRIRRHTNATVEVQVLEEIIDFYVKFMYH